MLVGAGIRGWKMQHKIELSGDGGLTRVVVDFAFPRARIAIEIDGCFWHGCPTCYPEAKGMPVARRAYWQCKIAANKARDARNKRRLLCAGWTVWRFREHVLRDRECRRAILRAVKTAPMLSGGLGPRRAAPR